MVDNPVLLRKRSGFLSCLGTCCLTSFCGSNFILGLAWFGDRTRRKTGAHFLGVAQWWKEDQFDFRVDSVPFFDGHKMALSLDCSKESEGNHLEGLSNFERRPSSVAQRVEEYKVHLLRPCLKMDKQVETKRSNASEPHPVAPGRKSFLHPVAGK